MIYKRVRGWTLGQSLPVLNFVKYPPPPGGGKQVKIIRHLSSTGPLNSTFFFFPIKQLRMSDK